MQVAACQRRAVDLGRRFVHLVPQPPQQLRRMAHRCHRFRMHFGADRRNGREADAQPAGIAPHQFRVGRGGRGDDEGIARLGALQHVERQRGIAHAAREHAFARGAEPDFAHIRPGRHAPARGPQAEQAAACRRDADRAAAVVPGRHRHDAARHGRRGATARAARRVRQVPRIAGPAEQYGIGHALEREFRQVGLAEDDQAGLQVAPHHGRMFPRHVRAHGAAGIGGGQAGIVLQRVLEQEGHAGERSAQWTLQLAARLVFHQANHGVDAAMHLVMACQRQVQQFERTELAARHQRGKGSGIVAEVLMEFHGQACC
ncbi:hypothetical protein JN27_13645 [Massilia sp. BSC265]|nr:hypothetical protein JN27_13645 [Massilia sp. BSC265]